MADFNEILDLLRETQSFFKWESREYKDFRDALSKLNKAMVAAGNRALGAANVQNLRELTAKAREAWGDYIGSIQEKIQSVANQENPEDPLTNRDKRRLEILGGMTELLDSDLLALRNADPQRGLNLEQIILENRGLTSDIRGKKEEKLSGSVSTRLVVEVNGQKGLFTEDYAVRDPKEVRRSYMQKYPRIAELLRNMGEREDYGDPWDVSFFKSPEDLEEKIFNKKSESINHAVRELEEAVKRWNLPFPEGLRRQDGKEWFENPEFVREFSDAVYNIAVAKDMMTGVRVAGFKIGKNVPRRNAAMSAVADRLGMPELIARSKVMTIKTDGGDKSGVFMEWGRGKDLNSTYDKFKIDPEMTGKPKKFDTAKGLKDAANLQVLDFICGNADRHCGNMLYQFEEIDGVPTLTGLQGIDNDASFGEITAEHGQNKLAGPDWMRVMTRSAAETVLSLTEEQLRYSLYGLVDEAEIDYAWERTALLQEKIKSSLQEKWKNDTDLRPGSIRVLDDDSPAWGKLSFRELQSVASLDEKYGIFDSVSNMIYLYSSMEGRQGIVYNDHSRRGLRTNYYKEYVAGTVCGDLHEAECPPAAGQMTDDDIFALYRNRRTLHGDQALIQKGARFFDAFIRQERFARIDGNINRDTGFFDHDKCIFIDGMKASEYVRKYSPEHAGDRNYVKAQIMAALTSGRHHVDYVMLRTDSTGHFKVSSTEFSMDLSRLDGKERPFEYSRETRRQKLLNDEEGRFERQNAVEQQVLREADESADRKMEELVKNDPVRGELFRNIPYRELYNKTPEEVEQRLDREAEMFEKKRISRIIREKEKEPFNKIKEALKPDAPAAGQPVRRDRLSLEALGLEMPRQKNAAQANGAPRAQKEQAGQAEGQQNPQQNQAEEAGVQGRRRNSVPGRK